MSIDIKEKIKKTLDSKIRYHNGTFEKRATVNGVQVKGYGATEEECEEKFFRDLSDKLDSIKTTSAEPVRRQEPETPKQKNVKKTLFTEWAEIWFKEIFHESVISYTYEREYKTFHRHVVPYFNKRILQDISPLDCIQFFNQLKAKGIERTAETCYGLMNRIFEFAVDSDLIPKNPMSKMKPIKHERKRGEPLSKEEEKQFLTAIRETPYETAFLLGLYCGLRPCEINSARRFVSPCAVTLFRCVYFVAGA